MLRHPGAPYTDTPMMTFNESDLHNAAALGLLEKAKATSGSYEWEWYVVKRTVGRTSQ